MPDCAALWQCLQAFHDQDYEACIWHAASLSARVALPPEVLRVMLLSLLRCGGAEEAGQVAAQFRGAAGADPWEETLLRLTLGEVAPAAVLTPDLDVAVKADHHEVRLGDLTRQELEQQKRRLVGLMQVIDHHDQAVLLRSVAEERCDAIE